MTTLAQAEAQPTGDAADLLDAEECSPQCLLAREPGGACVCRCGGEFHGALIGAEVRPVAEPQRRRPRRVPAPPIWEDGGTDDGWPPGGAWWRSEWHRMQAPDDVLDMVCPARTATEAIGACMLAGKTARAAVTGEGPDAFPVLWVEQDADGLWSVHADARCIIPAWTAFTAEAAAVQRDFLGTLHDARRCKHIQAGDAAWASGFDRRTEAQITGSLLGSLAHGYTSTVLECMQAIRRQAAGEGRGTA